MKRLRGYEEAAKGTDKMRRELEGRAAEAARGRDAALEVGA